MAIYSPNDDDSFVEVDQNRQHPGRIRHRLARAGVALALIASAWGINKIFKEVNEPNYSDLQRQIEVAIPPLGDRSSLKHYSGPQTIASTEFNKTKECRIGLNGNPVDFPHNVDVPNGVVKPAMTVWVAEVIKHDQSPFEHAWDRFKDAFVTHASNPLKYVPGPIPDMHKIIFREYTCNLKELLAYPTATLVYDIEKLGSRRKTMSDSWRKEPADDGPQYRLSNPRYYNSVGEYFGEHSDAGLREALKVEGTTLDDTVSELMRQVTSDPKHDSK